MENENRSSVEYFGIILSALIIGYFLIITNPPKDLLQYDNISKTAFTLLLHGNEITTHTGSISIFLTLFGLICLLFGFTIYSMRPFYMRGRGWVVTKDSVVPVILAMASILILSLVLRPYYGGDLFFITYLVGLASFFTGLALKFPAGARTISAPPALAAWIIAYLLIAYTIDTLNSAILVTMLIGLVILFFISRYIDSKSVKQA